MPPELPAKAIERIINNPHSLPHIPRSLNGVVASSSHQLQRRRYSIEVKESRRSRMDTALSRRISESELLVPEIAIDDVDDASIRVPNKTNNDAQHTKLSPRYRFSKFPGSSNRHHNLKADRNGNPWLSQPVWHRIMRLNYRLSNREDVWRQERNNFLLRQRRERQFERINQRRFSNSS